MELADTPVRLIFVGGFFCFVFCFTPCHVTISQSYISWYTHVSEVEPHTLTPFLYCMPLYTVLLKGVSPPPPLYTNYTGNIMQEPLILIDTLILGQARPSPTCRTCTFTDCKQPLLSSITLCDYYHECGQHYSAGYKWCIYCEIR